MFVTSFQNPKKKVENIESFEKKYEEKKNMTNN